MHKYTLVLTVFLRPPLGPWKNSYWTIFSAAALHCGLLACLVIDQITCGIWRNSYEINDTYESAGLTSWWLVVSCAYKSQLVDLVVCWSHYIIIPIILRKFVWWIHIIFACLLVVYAFINVYRCVAIYLLLSFVYEYFASEIKT